MIGEFSLPTRRVIAVGLALLTLLLVTQLVLAPLVSAIETSREQLDLLRAREQRLSAALDWPAPSAATRRTEGLLVHGRDQAIRSLLTRRLAFLADGKGLTMPPTVIDLERRPQSRLYTVSVSVSGPHDSVIGFISEIERGRPLMRLRTLSLLPVPSQSGELAGEMVIEVAGNAG